MIGENRLLIAPKLLKSVKSDEKVLKLALLIAAILNLARALEGL